MYTVLFDTWFGFDNFDSNLIIFFILQYAWTFPNLSNANTCKGTFPKILMFLDF